MTAKEKAIELVDKFMPKVYCYLGSGLLTNDYNGEVAKENAKQCALICVYEIINILFQHHEIDYWKEVKQEIEKL